MLAALLSLAGTVQAGAEAFLNTTVAGADTLIAAAEVFAGAVGFFVTG